MVGMWMRGCVNAWAYMNVRRHVGHVPRHVFVCMYIGEEMQNRTEQKHWRSQGLLEDSQGLPTLAHSLPPPGLCKADGPIQRGHALEMSHRPYTSPGRKKNPRSFVKHKNSPAIPIRSRVQNLAALGRRPRQALDQTPGEGEALGKPGFVALDNVHRGGGGEGMGAVVGLALGLACDDPCQSSGSDGNPSLSRCKQLL